MSPQPNKDQAPGPALDLSAYASLYMREARLCLSSLEQSLVRLREQPDDQRALREAHRSAHTLKGMSATMRYDALTGLIQPMEDELREADRRGWLLLPQRIQALLAGCEAFARMLDELESDAGEEAET